MKMTRKYLSVEALEAKGYKAFQFGNYTMQDAIDYIKSGCEVTLVPCYTGHMVAIVTIVNNGHRFDKEMFSREMTTEEKETYKDKMEADRKQAEKVSARINAKNIAKFRR